MTEQRMKKREGLRWVGLVILLSTIAPIFLPPVVILIHTPTFPSLFADRIEYLAMYLSSLFYTVTICLMSKHIHYILGLDESQLSLYRPP